MIVEFANQLREHGFVFNDATKEAAITRFCPIIMIRFLLSALLFLSLTTSALGRQTETLDTGKVTASIISSLDRAAPGGTVWVALRTELDEGWHTYWRNPGDSGEPVQLTWLLPQGVDAGPIAWPVPYPIPTGPIVNYGFEGAPLFPVELTIPETMQTGETLSLTLDFYYLVCADICIPEEGQLSLDLDIGEPVADALWGPQIEMAVLESPRRGNIAGAAEVANDILTLTFADLPEGRVSEAYFFPFVQGVLGHSAAQNFRPGDNGIALVTEPEFLWTNGIPDTIEGVLKYNLDGAVQSEVVTLATHSALDIGESGQAGTSMGLLAAAFGALLGGLILNLMPCVFPIISLKALSLAKSAHGDRLPARRGAWAYTLGVLLTFAVLAGVLIIFKAAGAQIGWGFQLQSPKVVGVLALLLFVIGLNLLGLFEIGSRLQGVGGGMASRGGLSGSFFTGVLAVIVATPCTAPFMAGAVGYALAQPALTTLIVFLALGFGFALPFLLLGYIPGLLAKLPKPGPWMETFRQVLAFPMFAAAIWLVWVLILQAGANGAGLLLIAMLLAGFAIWLRRRGSAILRGLALIMALGALVLPLTLSTGAVGGAAGVTTVSLEAEAWSPERVAELRAEGRPVFVDFTAAWCVTCKVNEQLVLKTDRTQALFERTNTAFLIADWTNRDAQIAAELERYGRAGVPLYLAYPKSHKDVIGLVLPQNLSFGVLEDMLEE